MDPGVLMRRLLHALFAFAVLLGTWAEPQTAPSTPAQACACCDNEPACGCGMPQTPRTPRCPGGQVQLLSVVAPEVRQAAQAEPAARESHPWDGLDAISVGLGGVAPMAFPALPRPPDRLLQRLALLSTFRN